jgi:hypothetical protein
MNIRPPFGSSSSKSRKVPHHLPRGSFFLSRIDTSRRKIAEKLGVSFRAIKFRMKTPIDNRRIKLFNFNDLKQKLDHVYLLTAGRVVHRAKLATRFVVHKLAEHDAIKDELAQLEVELAAAPNMAQN